MGTPELFDLPCRRQLYDLIYHIQLLENGLAPEINDFQKEFTDIKIRPFEEAYAQIFLRHDALRTTFKLIDGKVKQQLYPYSAERFSILYYDLRSVDQESHSANIRTTCTEIRSSFNEVSTHPIAQGILFQKDQTNFLFVFLCHHVISDNYSMKLLSDEFTMLYEGLAQGESDVLPANEISCREFLQRRTQSLAGPYGERLVAYWEKKMEKYMKPLDLRKAYVHFENKMKCTAEIPVGSINRPKDWQKANWSQYTTLFEDYDPLQEVVKELGVPPRVALISTFYLCMHLVFGTNKVLANTLVPGRNEKHASRIVGNLVGNIFLKSDIEKLATLKEIIQNLYKDFLQSCRFTIYEFEPFFKFDDRENCEFLVNFNDFYANRDVRYSLDEVNKHLPNKEYYSLTFNLMEFKNGYHFRWIYQQEVYTPSVIEHIARVHLQILQTLLHHPEAKLEDL